MNVLNKCITGFLMLCLMGLYFPGKASCADSQMFVKTDEKSITRHEPKVMSVQEKEIPKVKAGKKYFWIGLGSLLVAGGAAAVLASGSSDGGGPDNSGGFKAEW